jgi:tripartite-type tricarboxylate transporter receptor subunit TctC
MLAVAGAKRSSFFPEVPTLSELGMKGAELDIWFGLWAPNGTPPEVAARMASEIGKALTLPAIKTRYEALGAEPVGLNNADFKKLLTAETQQLSAVIRDSKISVD